MTDREKARDLGNQSAALARSIADVLNDTLDALEAAEAERDKALGIELSEVMDDLRAALAEVARLREALDCADWYISNLQDVMARKVVRGLDEAKAGYEATRAALSKEDTDE